MVSRIELTGKSAEPFLLPEISAVEGANDLLSEKKVLVHAKDPGGRKMLMRMSYPAAVSLLHALGEIESILPGQQVRGTKVSIPPSLNDEVEFPGLAKFLGLIRHKQNLLPIRICHRYDATGRRFN